MSNMLEKLKKSGLGHIFGANMINQIIAFASNFILIRILSKSEYGVYAYAFNIYSFFLLAAGFGMESACLQVCSEHRLQRDRANSFMRYGLLFGSGFNVFLGGVIALIALFIPLALNGANGVLGLFVFLPLLTTIFNCVQIYFRYNLLNIIYSKCSVINTALILFGSVIGAMLFETSGLILFRNLAMAISIVIAVCLFKFPVKEILTAVKLTLEEKKDMLKLAAISMLNISTGQILYLADVFFIGVLISSETVVASYKTATIIPNAMLFVPSALVIYIYPYFAQNQSDKLWIKKNFYKVLKYFAPANAVISIGLVIFAPLIISILFGKQYLDAIPAFRLLSIGYFFSATLKKVVGNLLVTQRKLKVNFWAGVLESTANIVCNCILINIFGAIGAAIATLAVSVVSSTVLTVYFITYLNREISHIEIAT